MAAMIRFELFTLIITQSRNSLHIVSISKWHAIFLKTATPPLGTFETTVCDLAINKNPSGHLIRFPRVSLL